MNRGSQITCYVAAFLGVVIFGATFSEVFWQVSIHAPLVLGEKPLPIPTKFFIQHRNLPFYLAVIPWLILVGSPLASRKASQNYWDAPSFLLRYAAFATVEIFLFAIMYLSSVAHFLPHYMAMDRREYSGLASVFRVTFWTLAALVAVGFCIVASKCERLLGSMDLSFLGKVESALIWSFLGSVPAFAIAIMRGLPRRKTYLSWVLLLAIWPAVSSGFVALKRLSRIGVIEAKATPARLREITWPVYLGISVSTLLVAIYSFHHARRRHIPPRLPPPRQPFPDSILTDKAEERYHY